MVSRLKIAGFGLPLVALVFYSHLVFRFPFPALDSVNLKPNEAAEGIVLLSLGLRRLAADLHFIRLLQYYGGAGEELSQEEELEEVYGLRPAAHRHEEGKGAGKYEEMLPRAYRILSLDPYFRYACLYSAGALAFNLNRSDQALELLRAAVGMDPNAWEYHLYMAAITYQKTGEAERVLGLLDQAIQEPDAPALLKSVTASLYDKLGRYREALRIYQDIYENSRDPSYREIAEIRIKKIERKLKRPK